MILSWITLRNPSQEHWRQRVGSNDERPSQFIEDILIQAAIDIPSNFKLSKGTLESPESLQKTREITKQKKGKMCLEVSSSVPQKGRISKECCNEGRLKRIN